MTGHLAVPALDPDPDVPATMSPKIMTDLLRREMGFEGLVVTDALDMGGVTVRYPPGEVAVRSIRRRRGRPAGSARSRRRSRSRARPLWRPAAFPWRAWTKLSRAFSVPRRSSG